MQTQVDLGEDTVSCLQLPVARTEQPSLVMVGLNFRTAAISVREKLAFCQQNLSAVLRDIAGHPLVEEAFLLSTCNRTELYAVVSDPRQWTTLLRDLIVRNSHASAAEVEECLYWHTDEQAARHLFRVTAGLESMVLGEAEIVHQLKKAGKLAREEETAGTILQRLIDAALAASKRARTLVRYDECGLSVASLAVTACKRAFKELAPLTVMVLGAGETAELTLHYLVSKGVRNVLIANRTFERAEQLARLTGGQALTLAEFPSRLHEADIVISCTSSPQPILTRTMLEPLLTAQSERHMLIVDLAVPRDVEASIAEIPGIQLLNVDHLHGAAPEIDRQRHNKLVAAEQIVDGEAEKFAKWLSSRKVAATIAELQQRMANLREKAIAGLTAELSGADDVAREIIEKHLKSLVNDILRQPINALKELACETDADYQMEIARKLFDLT